MTMSITKPAHRGIQKDRGPAGSKGFVAAHGTAVNGRCALRIGTGIPRPSGANTHPVSGAQRDHNKKAPAFPRLVLIQWNEEREYLSLQDLVASLYPDSYPSASFDYQNNTVSEDGSVFGSKHCWLGRVVCL